MIFIVGDDATMHEACGLAHSPVPQGPADMSRLFSHVILNLCIMAHEQMEVDSNEYDPSNPETTEVTAKTKLLLLNRAFGSCSSRLRLARKGRQNATCARRSWRIAVGLQTYGII